jgi:putative hydroxymethylpyrimidine transport system substrate-binding protein
MKTPEVKVRVPTVACLLLACCCLISCNRKPEVGPSGLTTVRVRLDWTPWAPHAALYAAAAQGYFEQEGLKVDLYVPPDPEATIKLVAAGQDDIGISYMTDTILAREQGFEVKSIAALVAHPLNCIMTLKTSGIDSPSKLKGKTIGTTGVPSDEAFLETVLSANGLQKNDYKLINVGFELADALKAGRVDAIVGAYWPWEGIKLTEEGDEVNKFLFQQYGVPDYYELVIVTRDELAKKDPGLLRRFLRATLKGQAFVREHPAQAVDILHKVSPDLSPRFLTESLQAMLPLMHFPGGDFRQEEQTWSNMIAFMTAKGLLKTPLPASEVFTNQYLQ